MKNLRNTNMAVAKELSLGELDNVSGGWGFDLDILDIHIHSVTDIVKATVGGTPGGFLFTNLSRGIEGMIQGRDPAEVNKENLYEVIENGITCAAGGMGVAAGKPVLFAAAVLVKAKGKAVLDWFRKNF